MKKFGLSTKEKIKRNTDFKHIYSNGKIIVSCDRILKATYLIEADGVDPGVKIASAVHKKAGNAVWRNKAKRLIREAYRLNKAFLFIKALERGQSLKIVFSPFNINERTNKNLKLKDISPGVWDLMKKIYDSF